MKPTSIVLAIFAIALLLLPSYVQPQSATSAGELQLGADAYKNAHYEDAVRHFEKAVDLDRTNLKARLYLATACISQYIPGVDAPENLRWGNEAIENYQHVLDEDSGPAERVSSAKGIGYVYLNMKKFEDAAHYYQIAADLDPKDPEPFYSLGVIDWTQSYQPRIKARAQLGLRPEDHLDGRNKDQLKVCNELRATNAFLIEQGIDSLRKAIELRPDYDDAMAYLNLMYREKADLECDDLAARAQDLKTADHWVDKTLAVKEAKAEEAFRHPTAPSPQ
jgi:tetratricopeptide (TPR) repeat protein